MLAPSLRTYFTRPLSEAQISKAIKANPSASAQGIRRIANRVSRLATDAASAKRMFADRIAQLRSTQRGNQQVRSNRPKVAQRRNAAPAYITRLPQVRAKCALGAGDHRLASCHSNIGVAPPVLGGLEGDRYVSVRSYHQATFPIDAGITACFWIQPEVTTTRFAVVYASGTSTNMTTWLEGLQVGMGQGHTVAPTGVNFGSTGAFTGSTTERMNMTACSINAEVVTPWDGQAQVSPLSTGEGYFSVGPSAPREVELTDADNLAMRVLGYDTSLSIHQTFLKNITVQPGQTQRYYDAVGTSLSTGLSIDNPTTSAAGSTVDYSAGRAVYRNPYNAVANGMPFIYIHNNGASSMTVIIRAYYTIAREFDYSGTAPVHTIGAVMRNTQGIDYSRFVSTNRHPKRMELAADVHAGPIHGMHGEPIATGLRMGHKDLVPGQSASMHSLPDGATAVIDRDIKAAGTVGGFGAFLSQAKNMYRGASSFVERLGSRLSSGASRVASRAGPLVEEVFDELPAIGRLAITEA